MMKNLGIVLGVLLIVGLTIANVRGQAETALRAKARVEAVRIEEFSGWGVRCYVKVAITLRNVGPKPLLLLKEGIYPTFQNGVTLVEKPEDLKRRKFLARHYFGESVDTSPRWTNLAVQLDTPKPDPARFIIIGVNEAREFSDEISFTLPRQKYQPNSVPRTESWETVKGLSTVWLQVDGSSWSTNLDRASKGLSKKLRRRWTNYGYLWTNAIITEPFPLHLDSVVETKPPAAPK